MSSSLSVNVNLVGDRYIITASILAGGTLPTNIFIYDNVFIPPTTTSIGQYLGVCNVDELTRLKTYDGSYLPIFGNKYLKYSQAKIEVSSLSDIEGVILGLSNDVSRLSSELQAISSSSRVITIS